MSKRISQATIRRAWLDRSKSLREHAAEIGLSPDQLRNRAVAMGLPSRPKGGAVFDDAMEALWRAGVKAADIAAFYGAHPAAVGWAARYRGLPARPVGAHATITMAEYLRACKSGQEA